MIVSENSRPDLADFCQLMRRTDELLNSEAENRQAYYAHRNGTQLEEDVFDALRRCAVNTPFDGTIVLVSGATFPDILANHFYGVEVKSTCKNQWKSIGSSILESTRSPGVERIYLTFGKLGQPVQFKSRPYEDCLSGISVTHYPRYQIDMELAPGETIFDQLGIPYDTLRQMENPVAPVAQYYKSRLKPGESLWWAADPETVAAPPVLRLWTALSPAQKNAYTAQGYALFPEILGKSSTKYQRYALWLASRCSVVDTNIRDQFSAGGKVTIQTHLGTFERVPAAYGRIQRNAAQIAAAIVNADDDTLLEGWQVEALSQNRLAQWCAVASGYAEDPHTARRLLCGIFGIEADTI